MANNGVPILVGMATYLSTGKSKLSFVSKPAKIKLLCCNRQWLIRKKDKSFVQPKFKHFWAVFVAQLAQLARRFLPIPEVRGSNPLINIILMNIFTVKC